MIFNGNSHNCFRKQILEKFENANKIFLKFKFLILSTCTNKDICKFKVRIIFRC